MIKAIIVDDELSAIRSLKWEIEKFCKDIEITDTFINPIEAISAINYLKPDCIFLDIEMPEMDGFQLLRHLDHINFDLIITTAFDNYAIRAFKANAIDYLLKPIDTDDLLAAVAKIKNNKEKNTLGVDLEMVIKSIMPKKSPRKIPLVFSGKTIFVNSSDIIYCKSSGNYCEIFFKNQKKEIISKKLKEFEILINNDDFFRVHKSYLVNVTYIKEFIKSDGQYLVLENDTTIPVARLKKNALIHFLSH
ncbi:LytR/AlgR family response regulator transcription factor [Winogradskyella sp. R77965]|uniref:LytR/AlgR family response regulator transcription factor n=1 Tax=Winogradskyella sp. R77965 TaxID=3093872 RepID=UPI0037DCE7A9